MCGSENGKGGHYILYSISGLLRIRRGGIAAVFLTAGALFTQQVQQLAAALGAQAGVAAQQAALEEVGAALQLGKAQLPLAHEVVVGVLKTVHEVVGALLQTLLILLLS